MTQRVITGLGAIGLVLIATGSFTLSGQDGRGAAPPARDNVRGNVAGEWRYWGGDA